MLPKRTLILTILAMLAFAGNSLLCRMALKQTAIDAVSFTSIRLISGALMLWLIVQLRGGTMLAKAGSWRSALALFAYAACFSIAYTNLPAGSGALLLFGAVQMTMISYGLAAGEHLRGWQAIGFMVALAGLLGLLLPGLSAPPLPSSLLMLGAGLAWGIYSLFGKGVDNPILITGGNFLRTIPFAIALSLIASSHLSLDSAGIGYALCSGALTSAVGYTLWYAALPGLKAIQAATVQLSVPILTAVAAIIFLNEPMTTRLGLASIAVLGGIALVNTQRNLTWNLWFITWLGLIAGLFAQPFYSYVVYLSAIQVAIFLYIEQFKLTAFPVQVRIAYLAWVALGTYVPYLSILMPITTIGLAANLFLGYCPLARMLYLLPINRREPLSIDLVKRVVLSPPVKGRFEPLPPVVS
jgi:drug/metabolite transporter (DMT)-like permease